MAMPNDLELARRRVETARKRASGRWWSQEAHLELERAERAHLRAVAVLAEDGQVALELDCA